MREFLLSVIDSATLGRHLSDEAVGAAHVAELKRLVSVARSVIKRAELGLREAQSRATGSVRSRPELDRVLADRAWSLAGEVTAWDN